MHTVIFLNYAHVSVHILWVHGVLQSRGNYASIRIKIYCEIFVDYIFDNGRSICIYRLNMPNRFVDYFIDLDGFCIILGCGLDLSTLLRYENGSQKR